MRLVDKKELIIELIRDELSVAIGANYLPSLEISLHRDTLQKNNIEIRETIQILKKLKADKRIIGYEISHYDGDYPVIMIEKFLVEISPSLFITPLKNASKIAEFEYDIGRHRLRHKSNEIDLTRKRQERIVAEFVFTRDIGIKIPMTDVHDMIDENSKDRVVSDAIRRLNKNIQMISGKQDLIKCKGAYIWIEKTAI